MYKIDCFCNQCLTSFFLVSKNRRWTPACPKCGVHGPVDRELMAPLSFEQPAKSPYDRSVAHYWNKGKPLLGG